MSVRRHVRRLWMAVAFREWPWRIPRQAVDLICTERPPESVFRAFRELHDLPEPGEDDAA